MTLDYGILIPYLFDVFSFSYYYATPKVYRVETILAIENQGTSVSGGDVELEVESASSLPLSFTVEEPGQTVAGIGIKLELGNAALTQLVTEVGQTSSNLENAVNAGLQGGLIQLEFPSFFSIEYGVK